MTEKKSLLPVLLGISGIALAFAFLRKTPQEQKPDNANAIPVSNSTIFASSENTASNNAPALTLVDSRNEVEFSIPESNAGPEPVLFSIPDSDIEPTPVLFSISDSDAEPAPVSTATEIEELAADEIAQAIASLTAESQEATKRISENRSETSILRSHSTTLRSQIVSARSSGLPVSDLEISLANVLDEIAFLEAEQKEISKFLSDTKIILAELKGRQKLLKDQFRI